MCVFKCCKLSKELLVTFYLDSTEKQTFDSKKNGTLTDVHV